MKCRRSTIGLVLLLGAALAATGCRAVPIGFVFAVVGDTVTGRQANRFEEMLADQPASEADRVFEKNEKLATWSDLLSTDRFLRYRAPGLGPVENFYAVRVSPDDVILDVSFWIEASDGIEDLLKLAVMNPKVLDKRISQAESDAGLEEPLFVFDYGAREGRLNVYDVSNFTHLRPRFFILDVDDQGVCTRARYYGIAGGRELRQRKTDPASTNADVVTLNRDE
jgi:hypothetical protein